ncbi:NifU-like domain-containing protein [Ochromonadaceae sp. CCMP2298]|nr:NifU-like domain-containing protein [Ochromonadaceae sp. CCMP2298]|mmetsp:Transcript_5784/g.12594  ORF Transcript_5784/g.12594 Transcript_5784/m.12594 type:complete len:241 (-) Transcript_5784:116-838(-)
MMLILLNPLFFAAFLALVAPTSSFSRGLYGSSMVQRQSLSPSSPGAARGHPLYLADTIVSPFDASRTSDAAPTGGMDEDDEDDELPLTVENVEKVLDEMRPYLKADGGDVNLSEIDGPIVKLELVGACGTCPSSSMTMKMGLERKLKERIPEIAEVIQSLPNAPLLTEEGVETVLDGVRPFLAVAGGKISVQSISGVGGLQPRVALKMEGSAAALQSVKVEIMQRVQRHFMLALMIDWVE